MQLFGHICIESEPIEWHKPCDDAHIEVLAVRSKGELFSLVCVVEDDAGEAEKGIEVVLV